MKVFLKQHLNIFSKLHRRLSSAKWALLIAATAMFFVSAAAPNGCNFMISFGGNGPTSVTSPPASSSPTVGGGSPTVGGGSPTVGGGSPTVGGGSPTVGGGSPTVGGGSPTVGGGSPTVGGGSPTVPPSTAPTQPATSGPPAPPGAVHMVTIASVPPTPTDTSGFVFVDAVSKTSTTTIKKGTMVEWTNPTKVGHTVTADNGSFDSGLFGAGKTYSMTFSQVGTFTYSCTVHAGQVGTIVVTP